MNRIIDLFFTIFCVLIAGNLIASADTQYRRISVEEYKDKMKAGWVGQMAGVGWGGPTEFGWKGEIIPEDEMPEWKPERVNQFHQDDIYVEMTFMRTLEKYGLDASIRQAGIDFANSGYRLWHANRYGRENLRNGIAPPDSGHPKFNSHADDIDYQIEADYSGLIAPGLPNFAIELGETFGRLMNYGDGLYGGQFVGGMYAEAFFEDDPVKIVQAGLRCIPEGSQYAEAIRDTLRWYKENPNDWVKTWNLINEKYHLTPDYRRFSCTGPNSEFNIDAKINGAYIVMGLLYGERDIDKTIIISTRCGQDSDCNPSNAAGILCTTIGFEHLPEKYTSALNDSEYFSHTEYNFAKLIDVSETLVRQAVLRAGGRIEQKDGKEYFVIPKMEPKPSELEQCWEPGPIAHSRFTDSELQQITKYSSEIERSKKLTEELQSIASGWSVENCGSDMDPGMRYEFRGKQDVLMTHPLNEEQACVLSKRVKIPTGKKTVLHLDIGHHPEGDWTLIVKVDGEPVREAKVGLTTNGWIGVNVDLSAYAGQTVLVELLNQADGWNYEAGYWKTIELITKE